MGHLGLFLRGIRRVTFYGNHPVNNRKYLLLPAVIKTIGILFIDTTCQNMVD